MRFKYFTADGIRARLIESGQFADAFYVSGINSAQGRMIESSSFIVIFLNSLHWPRRIWLCLLSDRVRVGSRINNPSLRLLIGALALEIDIGGVL